MPKQPNDRSSEKAVKASFSFQKFEVLRSLFNFSEDSFDRYDIDLFPSGVYFKSTRQFILTLEMAFHLDKELDMPEIFIKCQSTFLFKEEIDEDVVPKYFTVNAPAITFPYIRAYISALTALSGRSTITLATLNLVRLATELEKNIEIID